MSPGQFSAQRLAGKREWRSGTIRSVSFLVIRQTEASRRNPLLPLHRLIKNIAVQRILARKCIPAILHAEHHERLRTIIAHGTLSGRRYADNTAFRYGKNFAVHLEFSPAAEEKVEFLMILVRMQESRFRARLKKLEGKIPPACMQGSFSEYFARNSHFRRKFQNIIAQFIKLPTLAALKFSPPAIFSIRFILFPCL